MTSVNEAAHTAFQAFAEGSIARRVHGEGVLILGGGRALLMQIAHPMVARGVAEHSNFRADRIDRLLRTLRPMLAIVFGTEEQALQAAASVNRAHDRVAGAGYAAKDPDLLLWVFATLVDTSLVMYERFLRPLSRTEQHAYYADLRGVAGLLCIPPDILPGSVDELQAYVDDMCRTLTVTDEARDIAAALFRTNLATRPFLGPARWLTAGLLPDRLRTQFGLEWGGGREQVLEGLTRASRAVLPRMPRQLRGPPWFLKPETDSR